MKSIVAVLFLLLSPWVVIARAWTASDGRTTQAELKSYDAESGTVVLAARNGREFKLSRDQLSDEDQVYLDEWENARLERERLAEELIANENAKAGTVVDYRTDGKNALTYHCYYPKGYAYQKQLPLLILFDPGGNGRGIMDAFKPVGEAHGWLIVGCDGFRNGLEAEIATEWFSEMLPHIEQSIPHDANELYLGGMSGGAWRAYLYSANFDRPWKGIVACGGWLGGEEYNGIQYRRKMAVAMINGKDDEGANSWVEHDTAELSGRSCKVKLFQFDGGHVVAPPEVLVEAVAWIIDNRPKS